MFTSSIITIGSEIMGGIIEDTNFTFIAKFLKNMGIKVLKRVSVHDNIDDICGGLKYSYDTDIIFLMGGLGPTGDDITREAFSKFLNKRLVFNENQWQKIVSFFKNRGRIVSESNKKQAEIIEGGYFIENENGTAPGMYYKEKNKIFFLLPGPPKENIPMIQNSIIKILKENNYINGILHSRVFRLYGVGEGEIYDIVKDIDNKDMNVGYYFTSKGWVEIHLTKFFKEEEKIDFSEIENLYIEKFNTNKIFWTDDYDLSYILYKELEQRGLTISFAESITGGNISGNFVRNPGVSNVFMGSIICYSNESKKKLLKVKEKTLKRDGAVSENTAKEMVIGLKSVFNTDISVAVTGIAGPSGGSDKKPVGLVYFGFIFKDRIFIKKEIFIGDRERIINRAINYVFVEVIKFLRSNF
ncbi:MAG TPA: CinA family nicotinamide mononucleotide deamidase-related protein [Spirochaetota bacterium]|nr:CinA family nicotinamide mononucleotide deamidase-related protein [Spirochaetota bacterium]HPP04419.1 CinA family nicotinamide mononucleotide deamidase-related protein [Spirochaetota bacterium]